MAALFIGCGGLLLCAASDLAQLRGLSRLRTALFYAGCAAQAGAGAALLWHSRFWLSLSLLRVAGLAFAAAGLALLLYTLFFSLPADTYEQAEGSVVTTGVWALCRHPGIWWFFLCTLGLALAGNTRELWLACIFWSGLDLLYALWQDRVVFPRTLAGYFAYRQSTPFLIPRFKRK